MVKKGTRKPELVVFAENCIGGVQSFYHNLLTHDKAEKFEKKWILADHEWNDNPRRISGSGFNNEVIFPVPGNEPILKTAARLQKLISNKPGVVVLNFETEMATLDLYRRPNKAYVAVCHDAFFIPLIEKYSFLLDAIIAHNPFFYEDLKERLPERKEDIYYLPYGIKLPDTRRSVNEDRKLKLIYIARLQKKKGVFDIPLINQALRGMGIEVEWTIAGDGPEKNALIEQCKGFSNFSFVVPATTEEMYSIVSKHDIFILPSYLDGMPVSLMETMGCGLVPLLSEFNEGIAKIITPDLGFILPKGDIAGFASAIAALDKDRNQLEALSESCLEKAQQDFDVIKRSQQYYNLFSRFSEIRKIKADSKIVYGKRIDYPSFPKILRILIKLPGYLRYWLKRPQTIVR